MKLTKQRKKIMIDIYGPEEAENPINIPAIIRQQENKIDPYQQWDENKEIYI